MILKFAVYAHKLNRDVPVHMYLPDNYMDSHQEYPVLYMFDGHNLFYDEDATYGTAWHLHNHIGQDCPEMIVVGIECSHNGSDRLAEYSPFPFYDEEFGGYFPGHGYATMHFIIHDLKPMIDAHYPTRKRRESTWIGGSSCGGLMALYGLYRFSHIFSRALAISPYIIPTYSSLMAAVAKASIRRPASIYFSWGAREGSTGHEFVQETRMVTGIANLLLAKGVKVRFNVKVQGQHTESDWEEESGSFLRFLFNEQTR